MRNLPIMFIAPKRKKISWIFSFTLIISLGFSFISVPSSSFHKINNKEIESDDFEIIWVVDGELTASLFPTCFYVRDSANITLTTSWGSTKNITLKKSPMIWNNPHVDWIEVPHSSFGKGNLSIFRENDLIAVHNVTWNRPYPPIGDPVRIEIVHDYFAYFVGKTRLTAKFFSNGSVSINHIVNDSRWPEKLPYNRSFSFTTNLPSTVWSELVNYLQDNQSYGWQSWDYNSPEGGWVDQGGFHSTLTITWNTTSQKRMSEGVDDDSGSGNRTYTTLTAGAFINRLLKITEGLITNNIDSSNETSSKTSSETSSASSPAETLITVFIALFVFGKKRKL